MRTAVRICKSLNEEHAPVSSATVSSTGPSMRLPDPTIDSAEPDIMTTVTQRQGSSSVPEHDNAVTGAGLHREDGERTEHDIVVNLLKENTLLKKRVAELEQENKDLSYRQLHVDTLDDRSFEYYTGLEDRTQFENSFNHLKPHARNIVIGLLHGKVSMMSERGLRKQSCMRNFSLCSCG
ncbi:uncharacterized protein LOC135383614 [Ornithodoros turicata]|uniref:uncharacterized protein LOC135383614 n=1 Tax=Ornithodoros turicata TaxID=34597 RepID=UPI0031392118